MTGGDRCTLDDWLGACGIACAQRHHAAANARATAELALQLLPAAHAESATDMRGLARLAPRRRGWRLLS